VGLHVPSYSREHNFNNSLKNCPSPLPPTHYEVLGITPMATNDEIQAAYRTRAKQSHPDLHDGETHKAMQGVNEAYAILSDPGKRKLYDTTMKGA
jgi:DnaJ-class molecular chaperone